MAFYNLHCIQSTDEWTKGLMRSAVAQCVSPVFVAQFGRHDTFDLKLFFKNSFTARDVDAVVERFGILSDGVDGEMACFALIDPQRVMAMERVMGHRFVNANLVFAATTHSAFNVAKGSHCNYQRLEFIGDSAIGLLVSQYLFQSFLQFDQGRLSHSRSALVSNQYLSRKLVRRFRRYNVEIKDCVTVVCGAERREIAEYLEAFKEEEDDFERCLDLLTVSKVKQPLCAKILADIYEAMVGAVLIDTNGNLEMVWEVIKDDFVLTDKDIEIVNKKYAEAQLISEGLC